MMQGVYSAAAGRKIQGAAVIAYASAGDFVRFNPHLHGIVLEGGFDQKGRFVHLPQGGSRACAAGALSAVSCVEA